MFLLLPWERDCFPFLMEGSVKASKKNSSVPTPK